MVELAYDYCSINEKICGLAYARKSQYMLEDRLNSEETIHTFYLIGDLLFFCEEYDDALKVMKQTQKAY